jgi:hypothetical protein
MASQDLRDRYGNVIGKVVERGTIREAYSRRGTFLGRYDSRSNETRDARGSLVGKGDFTSSLITDA